MFRYVGTFPPVEIDPLIHSLRWVKAFPFLAQMEAEIWRDDFDPVKAWVTNPSEDYSSRWIDWSFSFASEPYRNKDSAGPAKEDE